MAAARTAISTLLIISIVVMIPYEASKAYFYYKTNRAASSEDGGSIPITYERPDIYYIVLDEYASPSTIKKVWGYDNSKFTESLKSKGFYIAENSRTKYDHTLKALPSYLNMDYVDENTKTLSSIQLINSNKVMKYLKQKGYTTVALDGWYNDSPGKGLIDADFNFNFDYDAKINLLKYTDIFFRFSIDRTMLYPILVYPYFIKHSDTNELHRQSTLYILDKLQNVSEVNSPKYVYAHIICPHTPFVFDKNGGKIDSINSKNWKDPQYYLGQYTYISEQIDKVVESIIKNSKKPPIIIIQSDHGPRRSDIEKAETLKVFNAYLLPNGGEKNLTDDFSPINTFRYIFNFYFNDKFEILEANN